MNPTFRCQCPITAEVPEGGKMVAELSSGIGDNSCEKITGPGVAPNWFECAPSIHCNVYDAKGVLYSGLYEPDCHMMLPTSAPVDLTLPEPSLAFGLLSAVLFIAALFSVWRRE